MGSAMDVFDFIIVEICLVYPVESFDIGVTLLLECRPIEGSSLLDREAIVFGLL
jgi:hypothetical protein